MLTRMRLLAIVALVISSASFGALRARHCQFDNHIYRTTGMGNYVKQYVVDAEAEYLSGDTSFFLINSPGSMGHILVIGTDTPSVTFDHVNTGGDSVWACTDTFLIRDKNGDRTKWRNEFKGSDSVGAYSNLEDGVWSDYDSATGYDDVADGVPAPTTVAAIAADGKTFVDNEFWIDSIGEVWDGPAWVPNYVVDTSVATGGYMIMAYGQIRIDAGGRYVFLTSGRYDGTQVFFDFDSDNHWDDLDWISVPASYLSDTLRFDGLGSNTRVASVDLVPGHYRIKMYFWQWGSQSSNCFLGWKRPDADSSVVVPAAAFGAKRNAGVPVAAITLIERNGVAIVDDYTTTPCDEDEFTFTGELVRAPDDATSVTYHWDFGDGTTTETTEPTVSHTYDAVGKRYTKLCITYGGEFPTRRTTAHSIEVEQCPTSVQLEAGAQHQSAWYRHDGARLTLQSLGGRTTYALYSLRGQQLWIGHTSVESQQLSVDVQALPRGTYLLHARGQTVKHVAEVVIP